MNSPMETAAGRADARLDGCLIEVIGVLTHVETLVASDPRREVALTRLTVTVDELEALLEDVDPSSAASADACDLIATARALCDEGVQDHRGAERPSRNLAA